MLADLTLAQPLPFMSDLRDRLEPPRQSNSTSPPDEAKKHEPHADDEPRGSADTSPHDATSQGPLDAGQAQSPVPVRAPSPETPNKVISRVLFIF